ncbi:MAG: MoaD/ThiS family protein [Flavobacteriaceae bacterium]|nr:MoaD/ThiS family protein [Flavobacteriaceae bacterium]
MNLKVKYFGLIAEITNCSEETIPFSKHTVAEFLDLIFSKYPALKNKDFKVAQNMQLVNIETKISSAEIALLPPFSGG